MKQLILCDCLGTQELDQPGLEKAAGASCPRVMTDACGAQIGAVADVLTAGDTLIACGQERDRFAELAEELDVPEPLCVDLRDRAGWGAGLPDNLPKMSALLAEALLPVPAEKTLDVISEGLCLIVGPAETALAAAGQLADHLSVTVCLTGGDLPERTPGYDIILGQVKRASGAFGNFEVRIDALQQIIAGGRGTAELTPPRNGGTTRCDIILDLTGGVPLFSAHEKREGYLRPDPGNPGAVSGAVLQASHMAGTFEKTLFVRMEETLCAHARAEQTGCRRCLDICPTGAIVSAGDHVAIDPMICAGCGSCAALCPSGAITYDAPPTDHLIRRITTLARAYAEAGGTDPGLLIMDRDHGPEMVRLCARHARGLPADVIPLEVDALAGFGHAEALAALGAGFARVDVLLAPGTEREALDREVPLANAIAGGDHVRILELSDPEDLTDAVTGDARCPAGDTILPMGSRRQVARLSARAIHGETTLSLPRGAPYGDIAVNTDACTLCLSCVSLCPSGALGENPDKPQLLFQEDACLQCGICATICPEQAIDLVPQLNTSDAALTQVTKNEEEPFACVECGALFGVKSTIEKITEKLAGKHAMFANSEAARMIQMCDNCRVQAQFHQKDSPFAGKERPRTRTTDDYLSKRRDH